MTTALRHDPAVALYRAEKAKRARRNRHRSGVLPFTDAELRELKARLAEPIIPHSFAATPSKRDDDYSDVLGPARKGPKPKPAPLVRYCPDCERAGVKTVLDHAKRQRCPEHARIHGLESRRLDSARRRAEARAKQIKRASRARLRYCPVCEAYGRTVKLTVKQRVCTPHRRARHIGLDRAPAWALTPAELAERNARLGQSTTLHASAAPICTRAQRTANQQAAA
jgi:hypothetical protein